MDSRRRHYTIGDACEILLGAPDCNSNGIPDPCDIANASSFDVNLNQIPDECELNGGTPYCFGYVGCPCGNNSVTGSGQGCLNTTGQGGVLLGSGSTYVSDDHLSFTASNLLPGGACLFFQGTAQGSLPLFDGLRCAGGQTIRLGVKIATLAGTARFPGVGGLPIHTSGLVPPSGAARYYQAWYRNNGSSCGTNANFTSGVQVIWAP